MVLSYFSHCCDAAKEENNTYILAIINRSRFLPSSKDLEDMVLRV